jgi:hypothetical protein
MNADSGTTCYFGSESDARKAANDLNERGYNVELRSEGSHGQSFWEAIKHFFSGETGDEEYRSGAVMMVGGGDTQMMRTIVERYNGRLGETPGLAGGTTRETTGSSPAVTAATTMGAPPPGPHTIIGETAARPSSPVEDETETETQRPNL